MLGGGGGDAELAQVYAELYLVTAMVSTPQQLGFPWAVLPLPWLLE